MNDEQSDTRTEAQKNLPKAEHETEGNTTSFLIDDKAWFSLFAQIKESTTL